MRKRFYIFVVRQDWDGQLRRTPISGRWAAGFALCAVVGAFTLLGLAGSYIRMLGKVREFNLLRGQQRQLVKALRQSRHETLSTRAEVASLGSLAQEVAALYHLRHRASLRAQFQPVNAGSPTIYQNSFRDFHLLEANATPDNYLGPWRWLNDRQWRPATWPVRGRISSSFGERIDPLTGEGEFHTGLDIAAPRGTPVRVTADGRVVFAGFMNGYGRTVIVYHGHGFRTLYAHLSHISVIDGQQVQRRQVIGDLGDSGWTTGPNLHYEVRVQNTPVNPYPYLFRPAPPQLSLARLGAK